jgi:hypothetical protein
MVSPPGVSSLRSSEIGAKLRLGELKWSAAVAIVDRNGLALEAD